MDKKILILVIVLVCLSVACAAVMLNKTSNNTNKTNITNNAANSTNNTTINVTHIGKTNESAGSSDSGNSKRDSKSGSNPEYGSDAYVDRWDSSQKEGDSWAYTHSQPVKYEDGHKYSRVYNPDSGESYWNQIN